MVEATTISSVLGGLKGAFETVKALVGIRDAVLTQSTVAELLGQIVAAQEGALRLQERESALTRQVDELEQCIAQMETWSREKERYKLAQIGDGPLAYALKEDAAGQEPAHYLCPNCYNESHKSILQEETRMPYHDEFYVCHRCGLDIVKQGLRRAEHPTPPRRR